MSRTFANTAGTGLLAVQVAFDRLRTLRAALVIAALSLVCGVTFAFAGSPSTHSRAYQVKPYDTLWTIAVRFYSGDPREAVYRIEQHNHLSGVLISPGQKLILP